MKSGIVQGDRHQQFKPQSIVTRAEAAAILGRMLNLMNG
ncbi:S-layer homology domain-containing protein [Paenibacillus solani]